ncbi:MAG: hypothetical protein RL701_5385, partial [Pseudomonadota bacterium]
TGAALVLWSQGRTVERRVLWPWLLAQAATPPLPVYTPALLLGASPVECANFVACATR